MGRPARTEDMKNTPHTRICPLAMDIRPRTLLEEYNIFLYKGEGSGEGSHENIPRDQTVGGLREGL